MRSIGLDLAFFVAGVNIWKRVGVFGVRMGRLYTPDGIHFLELAFFETGANIWEQSVSSKSKLALQLGLTYGHRVVLSRSALVTSTPNMASGAPSTAKVSLPTCVLVNLEWVSLTNSASQTTEQSRATLENSETSKCSEDSGRSRPRLQAKALHVKGSTYTWPADGFSFSRNILSQQRLVDRPFLDLNRGT